MEPSSDAPQESSPLPEESKAPLSQSFHTKSEAALKTAPSEERKLLTYISDGQYRALKSVYVRYGSVQSSQQSLSKIELTQYMRFMSDSGIVPVIVSRAQAEVMFSQRNRRRSVDFWRWVEILGEVARVKYRPGKALPSLGRLLEEVVLVAGAIRKEGGEVQEWGRHLESPDVIPLLQSSKPMFDRLSALLLGRTFSTRGRIPLSNFLIFTHQFLIVPVLLSQVTAVSVFRALLEDPFSDCLDPKDLYKVCCFMGILAYEDREAPKAVAEMLAWLGMNAQKLKAMELDRGKPLRFS